MRRHGGVLRDVEARAGAGHHIALVRGGGGVRLVSEPAQCAHQDTVTFSLAALAILIYGRLVVYECSVYCKHRDTHFWTNQSEQIFNNK